VNRLQRTVVLGFGTLGVLHFVRRRDFEAIVPEYVPISAEDAVRWSGVAELVGAAAVAVPATRPFARWWLLGLLAAVYPANIEMAVHSDRYPKIPPAALWARLPLQFVFGWITWRGTD
jgi:uncharacterized membrane protein